MIYKIFALRKLYRASRGASRRKVQLYPSASHSGFWALRALRFPYASRTGLCRASRGEISRFTGNLKIARFVKFPFHGNLCRASRDAALRAPLGTNLFPSASHSGFGSLRSQSCSYPARLLAPLRGAWVSWCLFILTGISRPFGT